LRGFDWFIFFVADVQTGFGPFVSVYLTAQKWTQVDIGLVLSAAGLVALAGQIPGAALRPFDGCGHLFFHERPAETARVVTEHLRRPGSSSAQSSSEEGSSSPSGVSSAAGS